MIFFVLFYLNSGVSLGWTWGYADTSVSDNIVQYNEIYNIGLGVLSGILNCFVGITREKIWDVCILLDISLAQLFITTFATISLHMTMAAGVFILMKAREI